MSRISQRQIRPTGVNRRNLDVIKESETIEESVTLDSGESHIFSMTIDSKRHSPLLTQENISLFQTSISEANLIPNGSNIDMSDYQIVGPWREQDSGDGKNIVSKIFVRNAATGSSTNWETTNSSIVTGNLDGAVTIAIRFDGFFGIQSGATITNSTIDLVASASDSNNVLTKIYGIDEDDTSDFSTDPTGRTKTTAAVDWDINGVTSGNTYISPSIDSIMNEIVARPGWSSTAIGFLIVDDGSASNASHSFYDRTAGAANPASLSFDFENPDTSFGSFSGDVAVTADDGGTVNVVVGVSRTVLFRGTTRYITPVDDVTIT